MLFFPGGHNHTRVALHAHREDGSVRVEHSFVVTVIAVAARTEGRGGSSGYQSKHALRVVTGVETSDEATLLSQLTVSAEFFGSEVSGFNETARIMYRCLFV